MGQDDYDTTQMGGTADPGDSPETLDQEISEGADRRLIDPDHHIVSEGGGGTVRPLPGDDQPPFSEPVNAAADVPADNGVPEHAGELASTHQATDNATDIDSQQLYDEGLSGAAEASEPNAGNAVTSYDPSRDPRKG